MEGKLCDLHTLRTMLLRGSGKVYVCPSRNLKLFHPEPNTGDKGISIELSVLGRKKPSTQNFFRPETNTAKRNLGEMVLYKPVSSW